MSSIIEAGETVHIARSGRLILRIRDRFMLKPGENLFDNEGKKIGKVTELIGPVASPYASVLLDNIQVKRTAGVKLFKFSFHGRQPRPGMKKRSFKNRRRRNSEI